MGLDSSESRILGTVEAADEHWACQGSRDSVVPYEGRSVPPWVRVFELGTRKFLGYRCGFDMIGRVNDEKT